MKKTTLIISGILASFTLGFYINSCIAKQPENNVSQKVIYMNSENTPMKLGVFSVSLNVKDLKASREFYEKLGFTLLGGAMESNYVIMKNENAIIGLFHGMFEGHILTFNPGWDENAHNIEKFDDVRVIQKQLKSRGIKTDSEADEKTTGPASVILKDPDGNVIFIDQHR
ncbi:MAG: glyoxalase [Bacteroidota bacterium]|jgi:catechol 2,3-dioxygenase-like lactoylglutathione lyase family enzyme|nr:glyoxalase [Bacteroidota bacterium]